MERRRKTLETRAKKNRSSHALEDAEDSSASGEGGTRKEDHPACQVITLIILTLLGELQPNVSFAMCQGQMKAGSGEIRRLRYCMNMDKGTDLSRPGALAPGLVGLGPAGKALLACCQFSAADTDTRSREHVQFWHRTSRQISVHSWMEAASQQ